jgi:8-oxo-dGTP diphosphatase
VQREFPDRPIVGVGGVIVDGEKVLIVKRAHEPRQGEWSLPGGMVELGETLVDALKRELKEETGLEVEVGEVVEVFDRVHRRDGRIQYHFVIVDYLCRPIGGALGAADDAEDVAWVAADDIERYGVNEFAARVIRRGLEMARLRQGYGGQARKT